ncbi:MAG: hypothetical protein IPO27_02785 [Bacteroidetes bacterium]|nr:hypothetical protein [Bacteroidota bacterium]
MRKNQFLIKTLMATAIALSSNVAMSQGFVTEETPMMKGVTKNIKNNWKVRPLVTVGETNNAMQDVNSAELGYRLPGILDGIGAFYRSPYRVQVLVNSELSGNEGYTYSLSNGTPLTGARITSVDIFRKTRTIKKMSLAYDRVFDRFGKIVTNASQINEGSSTGPNDGFSRLCSATGIKAGALGFTRDVFFAGEETSNGQMAALDVNARDIYVVPMMGRPATRMLLLLLIMVPTR